MSGKLIKRVKPDRSRIDLNDACQMRHWTRKFGVDKEELLRAVQKVGPIIRAVAKELGYAA